MKDLDLGQRAVHFDQVKESYELWPGRQGKLSGSTWGGFELVEELVLWPGIEEHLT